MSTELDMKFLQALKILEALHDEAIRNNMKDYFSFLAERGHGKIGTIKYIYDIVQLLYRLHRTQRLSGAKASKCLDFLIESAVKIYKTKNSNYGAISDIKSEVNAEICAKFPEIAAKLKHIKLEGLSIKGAPSPEKSPFSHSENGDAKIEIEWVRIEGDLSPPSIEVEFPPFPF
jgi:hypothetical protein